MNKADNTYWVDRRLRAQRVAARPLPTLTSPARDLSRDFLGTRTEIRRRGGLIPSWVIFATILLATFGLCVTVTLRTHAEMRASSTQYEKMNANVESLRNNNATLAAEIERLRTDPRSIESAAREHLKMVRANEIVIPIE